jgi:PhzF family phenazine biosynthesis protein
MPQPRLRYLQLDVFTPRAGLGNPLGVVVDASGWQTARMQALAGWTQLVETCFVGDCAGEPDAYAVRIFTPQREIAFAGHPSIGSAHAALATGLVAPRGGLLRQRCQAGEIPIRVEGEGPARTLYVRSPDAQVVQSGTQAMAMLAPLLGAAPLGRLPPALVAGGRRWWIAELADEAAVRGWMPDHAAIARLARATDSLGLCLLARCSTAQPTLVVRAFPCGVGIAEDPASGAANGLIASYLLGTEPDGPFAAGYAVSQGREIGRDARIEVRYDGDGGNWIGGCVQTVVDGTIEFPEPCEKSSA